MAITGSIAACATAPGPAATVAPAAAAVPAEPRATIRWDPWGIPHVTAEDDEALFYAWGWAQARNHGDLLLRNIGQARGRGAEYWGEEHLEDDRWYRLWQVEEKGADVYHALEPEIRTHLDAFAAGIGRYLRDHPEAISEDVARVAPVTGADLMANALAIGLRFSGTRGASQRWLARQQERSAALVPAEAAPRQGEAGSNAWAVAPSQTSSGASLLLANPHLPWSGNLTFVEGHLTGPGVDVYGASIVGVPTIVIGFNRDLGWTHTVNTQDAEDLFEIEIVESPEGLGYRLDGALRTFERATTTIRVAAEAGTESEELEILRSEHGLVLARTDDKALAVRSWADMRPNMGEALAQWWDMMRAGDRASFENALRRHAVGGQNIVYADRHGDIAYYYGAATPRRPRGDVAFWSGVLPGDEPELLWTEVHPFEEMPKVVNPASGWVQNANDPPWRSTWPPTLDPAGYPAYFGPDDMAFRPQRSIRMLRENGTLSLEEMIRLKHSTRMEAADRLLPDLLAAAAGTERAAAAASVLAAWDRAADADSEGAPLFAEWYSQLVRRAGAEGPFARPFSPDDPLETPAGLRDPAAAVAALEAAAEALEASYGRLDVSWGEVCRLRVGGRDLPGNGGPGILGVFRVSYCPGLDEQASPILGGDSFVAAVEFGDPLRAFALIGYGNASQPGSPHRTDQLDLYATKQLRPVYFSADEIRARTLETVRLSPD
ncbi:MAG TPA: penicillin acylase family protein [Thermoanaerobaculia bacterium]|nr:penicillin acylase family protein [Thermoanaerobaculia bacterium]